MEGLIITNRLQRKESENRSGCKNKTHAQPSDQMIGDPISLIAHAYTDERIQVICGASDTKIGANIQLNVFTQSVG